MSATEPIDPETRQALASLLEESLPAAEQQALEKRIQEEPAVCNEFTALLRQDVLIGELAAESRYLRTPAIHAPDAVRQTPFNSRARWILISAACAALALISWVVLRGTPASVPTDSAVLALLTGEVQVIRQGEKLAATEGMSLYPGDALHVTGKDARSEVRFADGSRISAEEGTRWIWAPPLRGGVNERVIALEQGSLSALIEKQAGGNKYIFTTLQARVTVIGTRFRFSNADSTSTLELFEGAVRFQRRSDQQEISVAAGQRVAANADITTTLAATPLNPPAPDVKPQKVRKALLVTAEPLPFYAHDVAVQRALQKLGFEVDLTTFDQVTASDAESKDLIVVPSHKCKNDKVLRDVRVPVIAWHNIWHQDLGLMSYDATPDHALKLRSVVWASELPDAFKELIRTTRPMFGLSVYSSVPDVRASTPVLKLNDVPARSPLMLLAKGPSDSAGPRAVFAIDIREGAGNGARVETSEELLLATVRWCLAQREATK